MDQEEADAAAALLGFGVDPPEGGGFGSDGEAMGGGGGCMPGGMPGLIPINPDEPEYLVKWVGRAHAHNEWVRESTLMGLARRKLLNFKKRHGASPCNSVTRSAWGERASTSRASSTFHTSTSMVVTVPVVSATASPSHSVV